MEGKSLVVTMVVIYFALVEIIGIYYAKKQKSADDFLVAGRRMGFWLLLGTIVGTNVGGGTFMGFTADAFVKGVSAYWPALPAYVFILIWSLLFVRYVNRIKQYTVPDFLAMRYGESVRVPAAVFLMLRAITQTGLQTLAVAGVLGSIFGWNLKVSMTVSLILTLVYCFLGGLSAVIVTDFIQFVLQTLGPLMLMILVIGRAGGWGAVQAATRAIDPQLWNMWRPGAAVIAGLLAANGPYYFIYQPMWQRAYAAKDEKTAYSSMVIGTLVSLAQCFIPVATGIAAILVVPKGTPPAQVLPWLYLQYFPPIVGAIFVASLLAAIMSVLDSMILDATANAVRDIYLLRINPKATDTDVVKASRIATVIAAVAGLFMALWVPNLVALWVLSNTLAAGAVVVPALAAWFWKGTTSKAAYWAMILGGSGTILWCIVDWITMGAPGTPYLGIHPVYVGFVIGFLVMWLGSKVTTHTDDEHPDETYYWSAVRKSESSTSSKGTASLQFGEVAFRIVVEAQA